MIFLVPLPMQKFDQDHGKNHGKYLADEIAKISGRFRQSLLTATIVMVNLVE